MTAALKIIAHVLGYRLRQLEMANLAGAVSIMLALRLPFGDVAWRTLFALLLNVFVYLNNDYLDVAADARASHKDQSKVSFLQQHMREQVGWNDSLAGLATSLGVAPGANAGPTGADILN